MAKIYDSLHELSNLSVAQERTIDGLRADLCALRADNQGLRELLKTASQFFYSHSKNSRYAEKLYTEICAALSPPLSTTGACDGSR